MDYECTPLICHCGKASGKSTPSRSVSSLAVACRGTWRGSARIPQITTNHRKSVLEDHKSMLEDRKSPQITANYRKSVLEDCKSLSQDHRTPQYTGRTQPNTANQSWKTANHRKSLQGDHNVNVGIPQVTIPRPQNACLYFVWIS